MKKIANFIVKYRLLLLIVFMGVLVMSAFAIPKVPINTDIASYLPSDMMTSEGLHVMQKEFGMQSTAILTIKDKTIKQVDEIVKKIEPLNGVQSVMWLGLFADLEGDTSKVDKKLLDMFYVDDTFVIFIALDINSASAESFALMDTISGFNDGNYYLGGPAVQSKQLVEGSSNEMMIYIGIALIFIIIILLLSTSSFLEPLIFLITIGISIVINLGTNIFLGEVSIITFSASSILQLALAMDYSIFLMHTYLDLKETGLDKYEAMRQAIPKTFSAIFGSALTTIGGFIALFFMRYAIGADLGSVLAKGVLISLITVMFLQPALVLIFDKAINKTTHKNIFPKFRKLGSFVVKYRLVFVIVGLIVLIPSFIFSYKVKYNYLETEKDIVPVNSAHEAQLNIGSQIIIIVPDTKMSIQYSFIQQANRIDGINQMIGKYTFVPPILAPAIPDMLKDAFTSPNGYTYYIAMLNGSDEDPKSLAALDMLYNICDKTFNNYYFTGNPQAVKDLMSITPADLIIVSIVSALIIYLILLLTLKSFYLSTLLILVIQLGIWINLSITALSGASINFMSYIIISSIQLGATVDYAIFFATKYKEHRQIYNNAVSVYKAIGDSVKTIVVCMSIILSACLSVYFVSSNMVVAEITLLISRGALLSAVLVLGLLPATVLLTGKNIRMTKKEKPIKSRKIKVYDKELQDVMDKESQENVGDDNTSKLRKNVDDSLDINSNELENDNINVKINELEINDDINDKRGDENV